MTKPNKRAKPRRTRARGPAKRGPFGSLSAAGRELFGALAHVAVAGGAGVATGQAATATADKPPASPPRCRVAPDHHRKNDEPAAERSWRLLLKQTLSDWSEDKAPRLGAALAYYTVFSLAPLVIIAVALAGLFVDPEEAQTVIDEQVRGFMGEEGSVAVQAMVEGAKKPAAGAIATIVGILALLFGASGVFGHLQDALNTIWEVEPKPGRGVWGFIRDRFLSFTMVLGIGFLLLVSLVLSSALAAAGNLLGEVLPVPEFLLHVINFLISFAVITLLFAAIFKVLPDVKIAWRDVWIGAVGTALLFTVGKFLIGLYLGYAAPGSTYGAVGSLIVVLLWTYYSAQILFLGAEFTQAYSRMYGSRIEPSENARFVTEDARAQQGIKAKEAAV